jgi:hypothetical protein
MPAGQVSFPGKGEIKHKKRLAHLELKGMSAEIYRHANRPGPNWEGGWRPFDTRTTSQSEEK